MRQLKKKYKRPLVLWDKVRIEKDKELKKSFGLLKKHEIWKAETLLRKYRRMARRLAAIKDKQAEKVLVDKLIAVGLLGSGAGLDDVLGLTVENIFERRLQTIIFKRGLANSPSQARQLIVHGHLKINGRKAVYPSQLVLKNEEDKIEVSKQFTKQVPKQVNKPATQTAQITQTTK
jgi:small subunit ribosomal protein S4